MNVLPFQEFSELAVTYLRAGGWLMAPLALIAFFIWYNYFDLLARLKSALRMSDICVLQPSVPALPLKENTDRLRAYPGAAARLARHVLLRMDAGLPFREAFQQCRDSELALYSYAFYVMGALVAAAPLLGLLGTVLGMIDTFDAVALRSRDASGLVAGGISQALITTQAGLMAALPGTFGLAHLYRLYRRLNHVLDRTESYLALKYEHESGPATSSAS